MAVDTAAGGIMIAMLYRSNVASSRRQSEGAHASNQRLQGPGSRRGARRRISVRRVSERVRDERESDFVAVGTYKGWGPSACTDDYDAQWSGYVDGETGGIYFCQTFGTNQYGAGEVSSFQISYQACGPDGVKKWALVYGGTLRRCVTSAATNGVWAQVGLETVNTTVDRNIDVRHSGLYINRTTDTAWVLTNWEASGIVAPSYTVRINSQSSNDSYLAPFD
jgi:hypothetical protein